MLMPFIVFITDFGPYYVGPLARYNLNFEKLTTKAKKAAKQAGLGSKCFNPFKSIIVRSVELVYACEEAIRIIESYKRPEEPFLKLEPKAGKGSGCSEAPRGMLYHRYNLAQDGTILDAKIVPPTSQNQKTIERDLLHYVRKNINLSQENYVAVRAGNS
jgi:Coenzyme F420-reducing hydrogenase, alpha subunit